jgi:OFA family oxalate/formate antiporter-like MFS transporter
VFGTKYATTNAGLLYTAKGTASLLVPLGNLLTSYTGDWHAVFIVAAIMNLVASLAALIVLKPLRAAHYASITAKHADTSGEIALSQASRYIR